MNVHGITFFEASTAVLYKCVVSAYLHAHDILSTVPYMWLQHDSKGKVTSGRQDNAHTHTYVIR